MSVPPQASEVRMKVVSKGVAHLSLANRIHPPVKSKTLAPAQRLIWHVGPFVCGSGASANNGGIFLPSVQDFIVISVHQLCVCSAIKTKAAALCRSSRNKEINAEWEIWQSNVLVAGAASGGIQSNLCVLMCGRGGGGGGCLEEGCGWRGCDDEQRLCLTLELMQALCVGGVVKKGRNGVNLRCACFYICLDVCLCACAVCFSLWKTKSESLWMNVCNIACVCYWL